MVDRNGRRSGPMLTCLLLGCGVTGSAEVDGATDDAAVADAGVPAVRPGLALRAQVEQPTPSGHLGEVVPHGDVFYVANSWDAFSAWLLEPDGNLLCTLPRPVDAAGGVRCTTLAVHARSSTLYCSSDEAHGVRAYDIGNPEAPILRDAEALAFEELFARHLHVAGEHLYIARFDQGLWAARIDARGRLGPPVPTPITGNVRFLAGVDPLVVLTADRGLLLLDGAGTRLAVRSKVPLDGTPQDLSVRGARAAVALGSAGAAVVDLKSQPPRVIRTAVPRAVATSADLRGDALAVATLTGVYLYDVSTDPPRLAGFFPSGDRSDHGRGVMLDARFAGDELVTSDWIFVERFAVDLDGQVLFPDFARGIYVAPGADAVVPVRSESELPFEVALAAGRHRVEARLSPGETVHLTVPADVLASFGPAERVLLLATFSTPGAHAHTTSLQVLVRAPLAGPPADRPAPGDPFPDVWYAAPDDSVVALPPPLGRSRIVFYTRDCAAMWPVLEDAAHLAREGNLDSGATPLMLSGSNVVADGYARRWALDGAAHGHFGYIAPPEVVAHNGSEDLYEQRFQIRELPGAAAHPTDYLVEDGVVEAVEVYYRGAHPLR